MSDDFRLAAVRAGAQAYADMAVQMLMPSVSQEWHWDWWRGEAEAEIWNCVGLLEAWEREGRERWAKRIILPWREKAGGVRRTAFGVEVMPALVLCRRAGVVSPDVCYSYGSPEIPAGVPLFGVVERTVGSRLSVAGMVT